MITKIDNITYLLDSAKKCALCSTPVINPNALISQDEAVDPFPIRMVIPEGIRRRYAAFIASMVFLIPNIVCLVINLIFNFDYLWATYINATSVIIWLLFVFPFLLKKPKSYYIIPIDAIGVILYTAVFYSVQRGEGWLFNLAIPLIVAVAIFAFSVVEFIKWKKLDWPLLVTSILIQISVLSFIVEGLFSSAARSPPHKTRNEYVSVPKSAGFVTETSNSYSTGGFPVLIYIIIS